MKQSITEYPSIAVGLEEQKELLATLDLTVDQLEVVLAQPEYELQPHNVINGKHNQSIMHTVERVTGFGIDMGSAFEALLLTLGRVPTQQEFNDYCLSVAQIFWEKSNPEGIAWDDAVAQAVTNRNYRCYISQVVELHCTLLLKELFPDWGIYSSDALDNLLGVDLVVETETKRLYLHIFKNSKYSFLAFRKKQYRGGTKDSNGKFRKFNRNFDGDKVLMYEGKPESSSETTKHINGMPLFKAEWLENQLILFDTFKQFGEPLEDSKKLEYLDNFLEQYVLPAEMEVTVNE